MMVRAAGLEPTLPYGKQILSLSRLPIPPRPRLAGDGNASPGTVQAKIFDLTVLKRLELNPDFPTRLGFRTALNPRGKRRAS